LILGWFLILGLSFCLSRGCCLLHIVFLMCHFLRFFFRINNRNGLIDVVLLIECREGRSKVGFSEDSLHLVYHTVELVYHRFRLGQDSSRHYQSG
jgi:hypothetical protein